LAACAQLLEGWISIGRITPVLCSQRKNRPDIYTYIYICIYIRHPHPSYHEEFPSLYKVTANVILLILLKKKGKVEEPVDQAYQAQQLSCIK